MPNRILRDGILGSKAVNSLTDSGEIFYRRLMSVVDDYGRFEADPELIRARCFPRQLDRWPLSRVSESLSECGEARSSDGEALLTVYSVEGSDEKYLQVNNFGQRIRVDKKGAMTPSKYPSPPLAAVRGGSRADDGESPPKAYAETYAETKTGGLVTMPTSAERLIGETAERMYSRHPKKKELALIPDALTRAVAMEADPAAKLAGIEAVHASWCETDGWTKKNGDYAPKLAEWISDKGFTKWPLGREPTKAPVPVSKGWDPEWWLKEKQDSVNEQA